MLTFEQQEHRCTSLRFSPNDPGGPLVPPSMGSHLCQALIGQAWKGPQSSLQRFPSLTLPAAHFASLFEGGGHQKPPHLTFSCPSPLVPWEKA